MLMLFAINSENNLVEAHNRYSSARARKRPHHCTGGDCGNKGNNAMTTRTHQICATLSNTALITPTCQENSRTETTITPTSMASHNSSSTSKYLPLDYSLVKSYSAGSFFDQFNFYTGPDPTHGFVEYILSYLKFSFF